MTIEGYRRDTRRNSKILRFAQDDTGTGWSIRLPSPDDLESMGVLHSRLQFLFAHAFYPIKFCLPLLHNMLHNPQKILQERGSRMIGQFVYKTIHLRL